MDNTRSDNDGVSTAIQRQHRIAWEAERIAKARLSVAAGRLVSSEAVDAWIDSMDTDQELLPPVLACKRRADPGCAMRPAERRVKRPTLCVQFALSWRMTHHPSLIEDDIARDRQRAEKLSQLQMLLTQGIESGVSTRSMADVLDVARRQASETLSDHAV